jgi:ADP-heptose:LPS heptosyltransferase
VWVFHDGALGDHVMTWPILRALKGRGERVVLVARPSHRRLAAAELGIDALDLDQPRFNVLWHSLPRPGSIRRVAGVARVISFVADAESAAGRQWILNATAMFPGARIDCAGAPGSASREALGREVGAGTLGAAPRRPDCPRGPVVLHAGAGSASKRWPVERWADLAARLRAGRGGGGGGTGAGEVRLVAGHVEREGFTARQDAVFRAAGGDYLDDDLPALAALLRSAGLVVCADSGPGHLAAQLGVPTLSLFGPTDWRVWAPVGPLVRVVAPPSPRPMAWLPVERVAGEAEAMRAER